MALAFADLAKSLDLFEVTRDHTRAGILEEALIQLANQKDSHFGQVVILAGGAGSGKGTVLKHLIDVKGKVFDVDELKSWMPRIGEWRKALQKALPNADLDSNYLNTPENVKAAHQVAVDLGLTKRREGAMFTSIKLADPARKPNLIFDVTLKELKKLDTIVSNVTELGYDKKNIHIVWVLTNLTVAVENNRGRPRVVPEDILIATHEGVSNSFVDLLKMGQQLQARIDGNIVLAFNTRNFVDSSKSDVKIVDNGKGGEYVDKAWYVFIKYRNQSLLSFNDLKKEVREKILQDVPQSTLKKWQELDK